jgi:hypothetical protein
MRNIAAAARAVTARGLAPIAARLHRPAVSQLAVGAGAVAALVAGLLVGLPAKPVAGQTVPSLVALAPQADAIRPSSDLPLDVPFQVRFTKPMNAGTVASALTITPAIEVRFLWDATGQVLSVAPNPHWVPYTHYTVDISTAATDQEGLALTTPIHESFQSGSPTAGQITATKMVGERASPSTAFKLTFTRPVKLATVLILLGISPHIELSISGDDPTDLASQVFTLTPRKALEINTTYVISLADGGTDSAGAALQPVVPLGVKTLDRPTATFTPQDGAVTYDSHQPISITFSEAMDQKSVEAALTVEQDGRGVIGRVSWSEDGLTLIFTARYTFYVGSRISVRVTASARSAGGLTMAATAGADFLVSNPRLGRVAYTTRVPMSGGIASSTAPWHAMEIYYLNLMNCTRTGKWLTSGGMCSTDSHHTLPAQPPLAYNTGLANSVARPYAKALADRVALTHYLDGTTPSGRMCSWGGYCGASWGENVGNAGAANQAGMIAVEIYFQNEYWNKGGHYRNIMNAHFHTAGIGLWYSNCARIVIDFYS